MDRYRLAPVRDARDRDERIKRGDLAAAAGDVREAAADLEAARERVLGRRQTITDIEARRAAAAARGATIAELVVIERYLARCRGELADLVGAELRAEAAHRGRQGDADTARARLARARADRQVIERHFERWRTEKKKLADRRED